MNIHPQAIVHKNAQLGEDVTVGPFAMIGEHAVIGNGSNIGAHVVIEGHTEIGEQCVFYTGAIIGTHPQDLKYKGEPTRLVIGNNSVFREYVTVNIGTPGGGGITTVGNNCFLMAYAHIAHDCHVGNNVIMANCVPLSGHTTVEDFAILGGMSAVHQFTRIGAHCMVGGGSIVIHDVPPYMMAVGNHAKIYGLNSVGLKRRNFPAESIHALQKAYRLLYRSKLNFKNAVARIKAEVPTCPEVEHLLTFIEGSERGLCRGASRQDH